MNARGVGCAIAIALCLSCNSNAEPASADSRDAGGSELIGSFNVNLIAPGGSDLEGHTSVIGKVYDGPSPSQLVWEEAMHEGDCRLLIPRVPFCPEACGGDAVCVEDGVCQPYPAARSVGTVRVYGVQTTSGAKEFAMDPIANAYQPKASIKLPFPAFSEGDEIGLKASGGDLEAFAIEAKGIAPLSVSSKELRLERDAPLDLAWSKPTVPGGSRARLKLDISHHGGSKGVIECDFEDTGDAQLPAALLTRLLELGVAGYPSLILSRESAASASTRAGRVELLIASKVERFVKIEGLQSCTSGAECGAGKMCRADLTCG
jgi:hypothetical protein